MITVLVLVLIVLPIILAVWGRSSGGTDSISKSCTQYFGRQWKGLILKTK